MTAIPACGLFVKQNRSLPEPIAVPLRAVGITGRLVGSSAELCVRQRFHNSERQAIEAVYVFPLPSDAAICGFVAEVDGRRIIGAVEEREIAFERYDEALADGHAAFLLDQERPNIFTASVGNLLPDKEATVEIRFLLPCAFEGEAVRFQLPTTIAPRYVPLETKVEVGEPDALKVNPEKWLSVPYHLSFELEIEGSGIRRISSPSHALDLELGMAGARVKLAKAEETLDRDLVILIEQEKTDQPRALLARDDAGSSYVQVELVPRLEVGPCARRDFALDRRPSQQRRRDHRPGAPELGQSNLHFRTWGRRRRVPGA